MCVCVRACLLACVCHSPRVRARARVQEGDKIIACAIQNFGRVDIVINNAGILRDTSFAKMTDEQWDLVMRVHVRGAYKVG